VAFLCHLFLFLFSAELGFELRASHLLGRCSTSESYTQPLLIAFKETKKKKRLKKIYSSIVEVTSLCSAIRKHQ
jgi:hypothetical protein